MFIIAYRLLITAFTLLACAYIVPGIAVENIYVALVAALVLGALNLVVRPLLVFFTLPLTLVTFGLFIFLINAFLFWCVAHFVDGFSVGGFLPAFVGSLIVSLASTLAQRFIS